MKDDQRRSNRCALALITGFAFLLLVGVGPGSARTREATPPSNSSPPVITGATQAGQTLTAVVGVWTGTAPINFVFQWQRCDASGGGCADVTGATAQTYALGPADVGHRMRVGVGATNSAGAAALLSGVTDAVRAAPTAPASVSPPAIFGLAQEGRTLVASSGIWSGTTPIAFAYQWRRCDAGGGGCSDIAGGGPAPAYTLVADDVGHTIRVGVQATNAAGSTGAESAASVLVAAKAPPPVVAPASKDECKHHGWRRFGSTFRNQGQCVSFVVSRRGVKQRDSDGHRDEGGHRGHGQGHGEHDD